MVKLWHIGVNHASLLFPGIGVMSLGGIGCQGGVKGLLWCHFARLVSCHFARLMSCHFARLASCQWCQGASLVSLCGIAVVSLGVICVMPMVSRGVSHRLVGMWNDQMVNITTAPLCLYDI